MFLHNGGTSHRIWRAQMQELSRSHEVVALDFPGFGGSARWRPGGSRLEDHVEIIAEAVDRWNLAPVSLVGNCMGSAAALAYAQRYPANVRALVLINPLTSDTLAKGGLGPFLRINGSAAGRRLLRSLAETLTIPRMLAPSVVKFQLGPDGRRAEVHRNTDLLADLTGRDRLPALVDLLDDSASYARLAKTPDRLPPTCTIWGSRNRVLSPAAGHMLSEALAVTRSEYLDGCGHLPMLEAPDRITAIISEFIASDLVEAW